MRSSAFGCAGPARGIGYSGKPLQTAANRFSSWLEAFTSKMAAFSSINGATDLTALGLFKVKVDAALHTVTVSLMLGATS